MGFGFWAPFNQLDWIGFDSSPRILNSFALYCNVQFQISQGVYKLDGIDSVG